MQPAVFAFPMICSTSTFPTAGKYRRRWNGSHACETRPPKQRKNWRLIGCGVGIHWEDVDEDISVASLLRA
jgi:hypothetical protein